MKDKSFTLSLFAGKNFEIVPWGFSYWQHVARLNEKYFFSQGGDGHQADLAADPRPCCDLGQMPDDHLLDQYLRTHESTYMGELYSRYAHLVLGTCIKYLKDDARAQDAVSDIFAKLVRKLKTFQPSYFAGWLYKVSRNHCLEILRKEQARPAFESFESIKDYDALSEEKEPDYIRREIVADELAGALAKIPHRQRNCIELFYLKGMSYKEVSAQTGYSLKEVKSYVQNGKRNLRNHLHDSATEYGWKKTI